MPDEIVADASVVAKFFFHEEEADRARALLRSGIRMIAPDLLHIELASVALKRARRGEDPQRGFAALDSLTDVIDEFAPLETLARPALETALKVGCSIYDAAYIALAVRRRAPLLTADGRLFRRARESSLDEHVLLLEKAEL